MKQRLTDSRLANIRTRTIHQAFTTYQTQFEAITHRPRGRFEDQDWQGLHDDAAKRLGVYRRIVDLVEASLRDLLADRVQNKPIWASMKAVYSSLVAEPWFHVNDGDIFPQEFVHFLGLSDNLRISFSRYHGDLFDVSSWRPTQDRLLAGEQVHIFPYARSQRIHA